MVKFVFVIVILMQALPVLMAQSCFEIISDNNGKDISGYQDELETAACELKDAFPEAFQSQFQVYDFGLHFNNDLMECSSADIWSQVESEIHSPYYLVFGRLIYENVSQNKFVVYLHLPKDGLFEWIDSLTPNARMEMPLKLETMAIELVEENHNFFSAEKVVIDYVSDIIEKLVYCSESRDNLYDRISCFSPCWITPKQQCHILKDKGFFFEFANVTSDPDYHPIALNEDNKATTHSAFLPLDITVDFGSNKILSIDEFIEEIIDSHINDMSDRIGFLPKISCYKYKFPRDCGVFDDTWNQYDSDGSEFKIFVAVVNWDNDFCVISIHTGTNYTFNNGDKDSDSKRIKDE